MRSWKAVDPPLDDLTLATVGTSPHLSFQKPRFCYHSDVACIDNQGIQGKSCGVGTHRQCTIWSGYRINEGVHVRWSTTRLEQEKKVILEDGREGVWFILDWVI